MNGGHDAGNDLKTIVYSVNEKTLTKDDQVISAASCTTNCLAPMADTLNKTFPIVSGTVSYTHLGAAENRQGVPGGLSPPSRAGEPPCAQ